MSWRLTRGTCSHHQFEALQTGGDRSCGLGGSNTLACPAAPSGGRNRGGLGTWGWLFQREELTDRDARDTKEQICFQLQCLLTIKARSTVSYTTI